MGHKRGDSELPYLHIRADLEVPPLKAEKKDFFGLRKTGDGLSNQFS